MTDHVVLTGPGCLRDLTLKDGTVYDARPQVVEVKDEAHQQELMHLVSLHYHHHGHPQHGPDDPPFVYDETQAPEGFGKGYKPHPHNKLKGI